MGVLQGLNIPDLQLDILYGIPQNIIQFHQRKGCIGHTPGMNLLCLLIAEAWACSALSTEKLANHRSGVKEK